METKGALLPLVEINGVVGAFLCDASGTLLAVEPADLAGAREAARVGRTVSSAVSSLGETGDAASARVDLCFEGGRLLLRPVGTEASLGVVCRANVNAAVVGTALDEAVAATRAGLLEPGTKGAQDEVRSRVQDAIEAVLGSRATKPMALVAAAGSSPEKLAAAGEEAVLFARLFLGKEKADDLKGRLHAALETRH